jgi:hypothetical protein
MLAILPVVIALIIGFLEVIPAVRAFVGLSLEAQVIVFGALLLVFDAIMIIFSLQAARPRRRIVSLALLCVFTAVYLALAPAAWLFAAVSKDAAARMPANVVSQSDFRSSADDWSGLYVSNADWTARQTVQDRTRFPSPLRRGVAYELDLKPGDWTRYGAQYPRPRQADVITAQFYVSAGASISDSWVGLGVCERADCKAGDSAGSYVSIPRGQWTQLTLDLRHQYGASGQPLDSRPVYAQVFYAVKGPAEGGGNTPGPSNTVWVGLDEVAWYQNVGVETVRDQRGPGEVLYDFEGDLQGWQLDSARVQTTTLALSDEQVYRGRGALKLTTEFSKDGYAMIKAVRRSPTLNGPWLAHVYIPPEDSPGIGAWAKLYTYDEAGLWLAASPHALQRGWNTLVWETRSARWKPDQDITIGIQMGTDGGAYKGRVYVDDVQLFER